MNRFLQFYQCGSLSYESGLGQGSKFYFTIPTGSLTNVPMIESDVSEEKQHETMACIVAKKIVLTCHVLIVDDSTEIRQLIETYLTIAGATTVSAANGLEAIQKLKEGDHHGKPIDIVVLDMEMPFLDGYQTAGLLRERDFKKSIIALTAHAMRGDKEKCLAAGCNQYLSKPINRVQLVNMIDHCYRQDHLVWKQCYHSPNANERTNERTK